jgi:ABC-2 type transport system ATP-binding protein
MIDTQRRAFPNGASTHDVAALTGVSKRFGKHLALDDFSLSLEAGEIVALLGPNGAGKSSAIKILTGLRTADSGRVALFGKDPRCPDVRRQIGVTPQNLTFPQTLYVHEILDFARAHYPTPLPIDRIIERFELSDLRNRLAASLSLGEQRRVAVAAAFCGDPLFAVLDEPTTGLDVESRRSVWRAVRAYAERGRTVLLTTHYLEEAECLASRVVVLARGRSIFNGSIDAIKSRVGTKRVRVRVPVTLPIADVTESIRENGYDVLCTTDVRLLIHELTQRNVTFDQFEIEPASLERALVQLTADAAR